MKALANIIYPTSALVAFACFAPAPQARATCQEGCDLTTGNTFLGDLALHLNRNGNDNTATGAGALQLNFDGNHNTATGAGALALNVNSNDNTATGYLALFNNSDGTANTASGAQALSSNSSGSNNAATGNDALKSNTTGGANTANGFQALVSNTNGSLNTATGASALANNTHGNYNTANGLNALGGNIVGSNNVAVGVNALVSSTGSNDVGLGFNAGHDLTVGNGNVCIGAGVLGVAGESNTTRIRNVYSSVASGRAVYVNSDNRIGTLSSSQRYKEEIKPMDKASETLFALKPVTFRYKKEVDAERALSFGLIAEDVAEISPELITRDEKGNPQTVRYEAVNAMLLNEFLKEHHEVQELKATVAQQQKQIEALTAGLQKVSAQLELNKPAPHTVLNDQ